MLGKGAFSKTVAKEPRLSFKSMERDSDGHGLPALKTHSGYVEESLDRLVGLLLALPRVAACVSQVGKVSEEHQLLTGRP